jgi:hypothetical protein
MPSITKLVQVDRDQSVQALPDVKRGRYAGNLLTFGDTVRGPLLPPRGTRDRERKLKTYYWNDYNTAFRAAIAGLSKRVMSTPWEISGPEDYTEYFQHILMNADFGRGWESFVGKVLLDYSRYDAGAYIELIGMGDPLEALNGPVTGLSVLDSLRCWPTGDPLYPVIYYDIYGKMHTLHHTRVVRFVDMPDPSEYDRGYGECALSRCISPVMREILMNRYIELKLDDNPAPGMLVFKNLSDQLLRDAVAKMEQERNTDMGGTFGKTVLLFGLQTDTMPEVQSFAYTEPPEKFDFDTYKTLNMKEIALGIGLDIQDLWELTGQGIGTGTQSEILHQKSKGKALGRILKGFERVINLTLPVAVEFEFQYRDPDEDQQEATKTQTWAATVQILASDLTANERRQLMANQSEAIRDVITDQSGVLIRLDDADPKTPAQLTPAVAPERAAGEPSEAGTDDALVGDTETKAFRDTQAEFRQTLTNIIMQAQEGVFSTFGVEMAIRGQLQQAGRQTYLDGLREGGVENPVIDDEATVAIAQWRAQQNGYIRSFVSKLFEKDVTPQQAASRSELWVNKSLSPLYHVALGKAAPQQLWMWTVDPIKEHCMTCLRMNGQIHPMKAYLDSGYLPQSEILDCGGWRCGCKLYKTDGPSRGRIPTGNRRGLGALFGRIASAFRTLLGGG